MVRRGYSLQHAIRSADLNRGMFQRRRVYYIIICHITRRGDTCYHVCATWVPQIIGAVPGIQHGESRVTTEGVYSPNVAMSIRSADLNRGMSQRRRVIAECGIATPDLVVSSLTKVNCGGDLESIYVRCKAIVKTTKGKSMIITLAMNHLLPLNI